MSKINVLPKHIAELIAAGEVVERPSSAVKELLENSIDAGASAITAEIKRGGITYIRITDNGCGIARDDVEKAFLSHATSKLHTAGDLNSIGTLGFRGEALASVAAVSKTEIITKTKDEFSGTRFEIEGGEKILLDDAGCPNGTTIVVRDLFYNTPARMKFMKKDVSEANSVAGVVDRIALSHPEISIRFIRDGKETLLTPGDGKLISAVYSVFGKEFADSLIEVDYELNGIRVSGYISKPLAARPNRSMQFFFINGRLVKTRTAMAAVEEAYKNSIMVGKFPSCVLHVNMPTHDVDVNVHPAKIEVRFANEKPIFDACYYACKNALQKGDTRPLVKLDKLNMPVVPKREETVQLKISQSEVPKSGPKEDFWQNKTSKAFENEIHSSVLSDGTKIEYKTKQSGAEKELNNVIDDSAAEIEINNDIQMNAAPVEAAPKTEPVIEDDSESEDVRVVGEAFGTYIFAEKGNELLIIDKHAAHERILFEQLKKEGGRNASQLLLAPVTVTLSKEEYSAVLQNIDLLKNAGFGIDDFGAGTVIVRECPLVLENADISSIIIEIAGYLLSNKRDIIPERLDWIYHSVACRAAIKAGDNTPQYELEEFVKNLLSRPDIRYCPHGRPVMAVMTRHEIEKQFGRV